MYQNTRVRLIAAHINRPISGLNYDTRVYVEVIPRKQKRVKILARNISGKWIVRWVNIRHLKDFYIHNTSENSKIGKLTRFKNIRLFIDSENTNQVFEKYISMTE